MGAYNKQSVNQKINDLISLRVYNVSEVADLTAGVAVQNYSNVWVKNNVLHFFAILSVSSTISSWQTLMVLKDNFKPKENILLPYMNDSIIYCDKKGNVVINNDIVGQISISFIIPI